MVTITGTATMDATAHLIANFALQHLKAAITFSNHVVGLETKHINEPFGAFFEDIRSYASACYLSSVASLEALINEFFIAHEGKLRSQLCDFERVFWGKKGIVHKPTLIKYQHALLTLSLPQIDPDCTEYQDVRALIGLRNSLVHYKPIWDLDRKDRIDLIEILNSRFSLSPFLEESADFISMRCMTAGCTKWAISSTLTFMREFHQRANLDPQKMEGFWELSELF